MNATLSRSVDARNANPAMRSPPRSHKTSSRAAIRYPRRTRLVGHVTEARRATAARKAAEIRGSASCSTKPCCAMAVRCPSTRPSKPSPPRKARRRAGRLALAAMRPAQPEPRLGAHLGRRSRRRLDGRRRRRCGRRARHRRLHRRQCQRRGCGQAGRRHEHVGRRSRRIEHGRAARLGQPRHLRHARRRDRVRRCGGAQGSVLTSQSGNVALERGSQMLLVAGSGAAAGSASGKTGITALP